MAGVGEEVKDVERIDGDLRQVAGVIRELGVVRLIEKEDVFVVVQREHGDEVVVMRDVAAGQPPQC